MLKIAILKIKTFTLLMPLIFFSSLIVKAESAPKSIGSIVSNEAEELEPYLMDFDELDYISADLRNKYLKILKPLLLKLPTTVYAGEKVLLESSKNETSWKALQLKIEQFCLLKDKSKTCENLMDARSDLFLNSRARK